MLGLGAQGVAKFCFRATSKYLRPPRWLFRPLKTIPIFKNFRSRKTGFAKPGLFPPGGGGDFPARVAPVMVVSWHNRVCKTGFAKPGLHNRVCSWSLELGGLVRGGGGRPPLLGPGTVPFGSREIGGGARRRGVGCPRFGWGVGGLGRRRRGVTSWRRAPPPTGRQPEKIPKSETIFDARSHLGEGCQPENALQKRNIAAQLQAIRNLPDQ